LTSVYVGSNPTLSTINKRSPYAKRNRPELTVSGKTIDGKMVVRGLSKIVSTYGIPLEDCLEILVKKNMVVDWEDYYKESIKSGVKESSLVFKIESAVGDCFGSEYREEVSKRLKLLK
jgi:hypothetical protein